MSEVDVEVAAIVSLPPSALLPAFVVVVVVIDAVVVGVVCSQFSVESNHHFNPFCSE